MNDADLMLHWRNHEQIRNKSTNRKVIGRNEHKQWLLNSIESGTCIIYIASLEGVDIGVVSFTIENIVATANIYLNPDYCGKGYGADVLQKGMDSLYCKFPQISKIKAIILGNNTPSIKIFEKCGFIKKNDYYEVCL